MNFEHFFSTNTHTHTHGSNPLLKIIPEYLPADNAESDALSVSDGVGCVESNRSSDYLRRRCSHCCMRGGQNHRCSLRSTRHRSCMQLHPPAPGADVVKGGVGGCHDNTPADGEDVRSGRETYITIIILFFGGGGWVGESEEDREGALAPPSDVCGCTAPRCPLRKIDSTPFNTEAIIQFL